MFKAVSKVFVQIVMLIAFAGQAMAYNASILCEASIAPHSSSNSAESIQHNDSTSVDTTSSVDTNSSVDCCDVECCNVNCNCIANACSSFAFINSGIGSTKVAFLNETAYTQQSKQPKSITSFRYRPPIFIS